MISKERKNPTSQYETDQGDVELMNAIRLEPMIQQATRSLTEQDRQVFRSRVNALLGLVNSACDVDGALYLTQFAAQVADLYAATAVVIWFCEPELVDEGSEATTLGPLRRQVDLGWEHLRLDAVCPPHAERDVREGAEITLEDWDQAHQSLVDYVYRAAESVVVPPYTAPRYPSHVPSRSGSSKVPSNPTDSLLLFSPISWQGQTIGLLELALGPQPLRATQRSLVDHYLAWLRWLSELFVTGMARFFSSISQEGADQVAFDRLIQAERDVASLQGRIRQTIETALLPLVGQSFGDFAANQRITKQVQLLLDAHGLRIQCTECGAPAILRCQRAGNSKQGAFVFDHYLEDGRTFHGGKGTFPRVVLVDKQPRRVRPT